MDERIIDHLKRLNQYCLRLVEMRQFALFLIGMEGRFCWVFRIRER
jgi:hypothetical protein